VLANRLNDVGDIPNCFVQSALAIMFCGTLANWYKSILLLKGNQTASRQTWTLSTSRGPWKVVGLAKSEVLQHALR
jgi:hypothetical protein